MTRFSIGRLAAVLAVGLMVAACKGEGGGSNSDADKPPSTTPPTKNGPPVIVGSPDPAATVGTAYSFRPQATDPEGDPIQYQIANKPVWATFDAATGRLSGTPANADVGSYANIVVSATDGKATVSLAPFSITVSQIQLGAATLTWQPPTENTDGSPVTDLAGYRIRYGQSLDGLTQAQDIPNPGITTAMVESLSKGTWYFTVTAYNRAGGESEPSNPAQKSVL